MAATGSAAGARSAEIEVAGPVQAVVVRAQSTGCRRAAISVRAGDQRASITFGRSRAAKRVTFARPAMGRSVRVRAAVPRRCPVRIHAVRAITVPAIAAPKDAPVPPRRQMAFGAATALPLLGTTEFEATLLSTFDSVTPENELKMERTQPSPGKYDFTAADAVLRFAAEQGLRVRGHSLIYGAQTPPWVARQMLPDLIARSMRDHITTVMGRYSRQIRQWDVVNEPFDRHGNWQPSAWFDALGPEFVELAFRAARAADPTAKLFLNEFDAERPGRKREAVVALVTDLAAKGLIDGVGLQTHAALGHAPSHDELVETMRIYERLGLDVEITEMDVAARGDGSPTWLHLRLAEQAEIYESAARACATVTACTGFTVWGVTDAHTWLEPEQIPLLFDAQYQPKPALAAVRRGLGIG